MIAAVCVLMVLVGGGLWFAQSRTKPSAIAAPPPAEKRPREVVREFVAPPGPELAGRWMIHLGKAVDTLELTETSGVLTGQITKDMLWGGETLPVEGSRFGETIELTCRWEIKTVSSESSADYRFVGTLESPSALSGRVAIRTYSANGQIANRDLPWRGERSAE
jgi:hypothetical protein